MSGEKTVPWHLREWKVVIEGELITLPGDTTVAEIRAKLPSELLEEFNECVEATNLAYLAAELSVWNLPLDRLLAYRREQAERYYRSAAVDPFSVVIPADLDVNAVMRTRGNCLLGTSPDMLPAGDAG